MSSAKNDQSNTHGNDKVRFVGSYSSAPTCFARELFPLERNLQKGKRLNTKYAGLVLFGDLGYTIVTTIMSMARLQ